MFKRNKASIANRDPLSQQLVAVEGVIEQTAVAAAASTSRRANDSSPPVPTAATEEELVSAPPRPALTKQAPPPPQNRASIVSVNPHFASSAPSSFRCEQRRLGDQPAIGPSGSSTKAQQKVPGATQIPLSLYRPARG
ncbi:hypothetical protein BASA81_015439 [Batrachochytrium salamandrivorans]|nr:hypothetical protein BASA81_015439 [Batrachochytrium salamandrivorans]